MKYHQTPNTYVGPVHLIVADLNRSLEFYKNIIGFSVLEEAGEKVVLTADGKTPLLIIEQPNDIKPKERRKTGLYHYAILLPHRSDLADILYHIIQSGYPLQGASDHLVSEALYLGDPDGHGIEVYRDRPSDTWKWSNGEVMMTTDPIDAEGLLKEKSEEGWRGLPENTVMGHIHLHVADLTKIKEFYTKGLGFDVVNSQYGDQVLFISTGGYHHHIGLNLWNGVGIPAPSEDSIRMKQYVLILPDIEEREKIIKQLEEIGAIVSIENGIVMTEDPSGNKIQLSIGYK